MPAVLAADADDEIGRSRGPVDRELHQTPDALDIEHSNGLSRRMPVSLYSGRTCSRRLRARTKTSPAKGRCSEREEFRDRGEPRGAHARANHFDHRAELDVERDTVPCLDLGLNRVTAPSLLQFLDGGDLRNHDLGAHADALPDALRRWLRESPLICMA